MKSEVDAQALPPAEWMSLSGKVEDSPEESVMRQCKVGPSSEREREF